MTTTVAREGAQQLTPDLLARFRESIAGDPAHRLAMNAVTRAGLDEVALDRAREVATPPVVSHRLDDWQVANQKKSGRCWLFSSLNLLRVGVKRRLGVKDFELSQNFATFWDKMERANFFLESIRKTASEPLESRLVQYLLGEVMGDGGQWDMAVSVYERHGVVPKSVMPETQPSSNTARMNSQLKLLMRIGALRLRQAIARQEPAARVEGLRAQILGDVYRILTINLGVPPRSFDWEWQDDDKRSHRDGEITPQQFFAKYVTVNLDDYVCLVDDPRAAHPKGAAETVEHLGNVVGGREVRYINAPIGTMKRLAAESIQAGEPVWFGCDVGKQSERKEGLLVDGIYDYSGVLGVDLATTKEERVVSGQSAMTHAMLLTGVDLVDGRPRRWRVENSWGGDIADKGFFTMDDEWFTQYVFEVAVRASSLPADLRPALTSAPIVLPAWDPMGSLA